MNDAKPYIAGQGIRILMERCFVLACLLILLITTITALYFNQRSLQERRDNNLQKIHQILTNLIKPELTISNTAEIRRLLQLASSSDEIFVVIDENGILLMPDYSKMGSLKSVIDSKEVKKCQFIKSFYKSIDGSRYWVTCSPLRRDDVLSNSNEKGRLLTFSKYQWLLFTPMILYLAGISIVTLLVMVIWFRQVLYNRLLRPVITLDAHIVAMTKSPLAESAMICDIGEAPAEIVSIKSAFEGLLLNLQNEYRLRSETEKNQMLSNFAAQVVHDIRSPLAVLEVMLSSSSKFIPANDAIMQKEALQAVRAITNNLLKQYRNSINKYSTLSDYSDIYGSADELVKFSLKYYIEGLIHCKQREWVSNPCTIELTLDESNDMDLVKLDPNYLGCMISNLLNNAYESLSTNRFINVSLKVLSSSIILIISDTGCGIPEYYVSDVLTGKSFKHDGIGLGLSGAVRYMNAIGGNLELHSKADCGTKVILYFPTR